MKKGVQDGVEQMRKMKGKATDSTRNHIKMVAEETGDCVGSNTGSSRVSHGKEWKSLQKGWAI